MRIGFGVFILVIAAGGFASQAAAQSRPAPIVEVAAGRAGYVDESWDWFPMASGSGRFYLTRRFAVGLEIVFLRGDTGHYAWGIEANTNFDIVADDGGSARRIVPYVAIGGGYLRSYSRVGMGPGSTGLATYVHGEGTASGGLGVRIRTGDRFFVAPEVRVGWEPEILMKLAVGFQPRRRP